MPLSTSVFVLKLIPALATLTFLIVILGIYSCQQCCLNLILLKLSCFLHVVGSWSQGRLQSECLKPLKPAPDMGLAQQTKRNRLSLGHHRKGTRTDTLCVSLPTQRRSSSSQKGTSEPRHIHESICVGIHSEKPESKGFQELYQKPPHA